VADLLRNHPPDIAAMDLFVVPTIGFKLVYGFVIVRLHRRELVWINVATNPIACTPDHGGVSLGWGSALYDPRPRSDLWHRCQAPTSRGIRDKPIAPASRWQNGFTEQLIGSIRRECLDHVVVLCEAHLRRILKSYTDYYNSVRTHRSLHKDVPISRPIHQTGIIRSHRILVRLHHRYVRV